MNTLLALAFAMLLAVGSVVPSFAQQSVAQDPSASACPQGTEAAAVQTPQGRLTKATVIQIDRERGLLNLQTEIGRVLTFARPEDMKGLHEGDQIVVYLIVEDDAPENSQPDSTGA